MPLCRTVGALNIQLYMIRLYIVMLVVVVLCVVLEVGRGACPDIPTNQADLSELRDYKYIGSIFI